MRLVKELLFATALTGAAILDMASANAHEIKVGDLMIVHPWSKASPMASDVSAGFMVIQNDGKEDDKLVKATAEITGNVQLHDMKMEGDVMKMVEVVGGIPLPAGAATELKPGSLHIMFMDLKDVPKPGTSFKGTLVFEKAGTVEVEYEVEAQQ